MESEEYPCYPDCIEGPPTCVCDVRRVREELQQLRSDSVEFGQLVLNGDCYGCENGPSSCLHMTAAKFLDKVRES